MLRRLSLLLVLIAAMALSASADWPFRAHRYDSFRATPVTENSIVFFGNSITNMHEWREAFGDNPNIINRGNSGGYTYELLDNIESVVQGRPAKLFIGIGTNDLGTSGQDDPAVVAGNIRKIVERFKGESPRTQVFVQSILPSWNGLRTEAKTRATNTLLKQMCQETGATYVDLFDLMMGIPAGDPISFDQLHVTAHGYTLWCREIAKYVGVNCSYPDPASTTYSWGGMKNSNGMRVTQWSANEVKPTDILIIGDEMIHGGEWHELLGNPDVKSRGIGWGYGGLNLTKWKELMPAIFSDNPSRKKAPAKVFLYVGVPDVNDGNTNFSVIVNNYTALINKIKQLAPKTEINVLSYIPRSNANDNANRVIPANDHIKAMCAGMDGVNFVDIYSALADTTAAKTDCITQNYLYGRGYNKVAQVLAPLVGGRALSDTDWEAHYALINARATAGTLIQRLLDADASDATAAAAMKTLSTAPSLAEVNTLIASLTDAVAEGAMPEGGEGRYYTIKDRRSSRYCADADGVVASETTAVTAFTQWSVVKRADGAWDIINHATGNYVAPTAAYNTQLTLSSTAPSSGWQLLPAAEPGYLIVVSGSAQFNTTQSGLGFKVYNWGSGNNTTDTGCQYIFAEQEGIDPPEDEDPGEDYSDYEITLVNPDHSAGFYRLHDDDATPFVNHKGEQTVAVDFSRDENNGKRQIILSVGQPTDQGEHFSIFTDNNAAGVIYSLADGSEGWFSTIKNVGQGRHKLILVMKNHQYLFNMDGNSYSLNSDNNSSWGFKTLGNFSDAKVIFIGGSPRSDIHANASKAPLEGQVHSLRIYNRALTDDEVNTLEWDDLTPTGLEEIALSPETTAPTGIYDLQGRRLDSPAIPGIYIIDGRKTLVR